MAVTITETDYNHTIQHIKFAWTSDSDGAASGTTTEPYDGILHFASTIPSGGGTAPTAAYDVTLTDNNSLDVLLAGGTDRSATATEYIKQADLGVVSGSKLTFTVAAAGELKQGALHVYIRRS